ncbi:MAG: Gmad2 immunoglobulin-like domain-containing protein [bacterium]|nr:Gmad2 immunoglobulin-like domain-containing protein [bacterium]
MKKLLILTAVAAIVFIFLLLWRERPLIVIFTPKADDVIASPLAFSGKARGYWFFEASFPVRVFDASGAELGVGIAQAEDEWMTEDFVPFSGSVEFRAPGTPTGKVVFQKDNPSGLLEHDAAVEVPVRFLLP